MDILQDPKRKMGGRNGPDDRAVTKGTAGGVSSREKFDANPTNFHSGTGRPVRGKTKHGSMTCDD